MTTTPAIKQHLTFAEVATRFRVQERTIRVWVKQGRFPKPIATGNRRKKLWDVETLEAFEKGQAAL